MTDAGAATGLDRLPWLPDEPANRVASEPRRELLPWAVAAIVLVAGASYWMGASSVRHDMAAPPRWSGTTVQLPEPVQAPPQPQVSPAPAPEVRPVPAPLVELPRVEAREPARTAVSERHGPARTTARKPRERAPGPRPLAAAPARPTAPAARPHGQRLWPSREARGASGRLAQIGAFGSRQQAKLGWRSMTRYYPAVGRLPAVVVPARNSRGRLFYRFQIGTSSHAHSEVLCQRMRTIGMSCAVVGLPGKARVER